MTGLTVIGDELAEDFSICAAGFRRKTPFGGLRFLQGVDVVLDAAGLRLVQTPTVVLGAFGILKGKTFLNFLSGVASTSSVISRSGASAF